MWGLIGSIIGEAADDGMQFASKGYDQYLWKKNLSHYAEKQYEYAQRYSENSPSWSVKGLRDAGLNPVLAVSNGVNLGANVPNFSSSSPSGMVKSDFGGKITAALSRKIDQQNADSNSQNAESNKIQAQAAMIQAEAALKRAVNDSRKTDADVLLKTARTQLENQNYERGKRHGDYRTDWVEDVHKLLFPFYNFGVDAYDSFRRDIRSTIDWFKDGASSYIKNAPNSRPKSAFENDRPLKRIPR